MKTLLATAAIVAALVGTASAEEYLTGIEQINRASALLRCGNSWSHVPEKWDPGYENAVDMAFAESIRCEADVKRAYNKLSSCRIRYAGTEAVYACKLD